MNKIHFTVTGTPLGGRLDIGSAHSRAYVFNNLILTRTNGFLHIRDAISIEYVSNLRISSFYDDLCVSQRYRPISFNTQASSLFHNTALGFNLDKNPLHLIRCPRNLLFPINALAIRSFSNFIGLYKFSHFLIKSPS